MRVLYRIARATYAEDLSGQGAMLAGGRWNQKGTPLLYTATSRSLACLEALVHLSQPEFLLPRRLVSIGVPAKIVPHIVNESDLPVEWRRNPPPFALAEIGTRWARKMESLLLQVPSAVVPEEFNMLINPAHPDMKAVRVTRIDRFSFDERLFSQE
ncbi:MAG: RES family NAD+ phosphorylase [Acidobacteriota bacterium]